MPSPRELYRAYRGALPPWQIRLALSRIRRLRIPPDAWQDAMQELILVILEFRYDPHQTQASPKTILCHYLDHRLRMLMRTCARRKALVERLARLSPPGEDRHSPEDDAAVGEVRQALAGLSPEQKAICRGLMRGESVTKIAHRLGRTWHTVARQIAAIREAFTTWGVEPW